MRIAVSLPRRCNPADAGGDATTRRAGQRHRRVIDRLIDRLHTQPTIALADKQPAQLVGDLLRAPPLRQQSLNDLGQ
jgi:hypothetical protein